MIDTQAIRSKILDLAMRGKLTAQLPEDGTAEEIYLQIQTEKQALIKTGNLRKEKPLPNVGEDEIPFAIPENWKWIRLNDLGVFCGGKTPSMANKAYWKGGRINWVTSKDMKQKYITASEMMITEEAAHELNLLPPQTVLFVVRSGILRRLFPVAILSKEGTINQDLKALKLFVPGMCEFVYCILKGFESTILLKYTKDGTTVNNIVFDSFLSMPVPLPPLAEQHRIVEKIKPSFSLLDTIDSLQAQYADNLTVLKSKLIDAAIQGKLTEQLPEDGTAKDLYQQIQAEKQALIQTGKIKKEKPLPEITDAPYIVPNSWIWVRWGGISFQIQYGYNAPAQESGRIRMVRITDIQNNRIVWNSVPYCDIDESCIEEYRLKSNNILFARTGGTVGKSYLVENVEKDAVFAGYLIRTSFSSVLNAKYMKYFMESRLYWKQLQDGTTATAQPNCNAKTLSRMVVPLPPLAEQHRIVSRLDEVLKLIET